MKEVHISGRFLRLAQPTGTQRSATRLLEGLVPLLDGNVYVHGVRDAVPASARRSNVHYRDLPYRHRRWDHVWEQVLYPNCAGNAVLATLMGTGPVFHPRAPHIMCVHDINYMLQPQVFSRSFRVCYTWACGIAAKRADRIVCFSNYVKSSLVARLGVDSGKIVVQFQGPGISPQHLVPGREGDRNSVSPFFLCVGSLQPHKNLRLILAAWAEFSRSHPQYRLVVVGRKQGGFSATSFRVDDLERVEFTGYIDDAALARLYRGATGFIYPSLEEGFGLPVVEAFFLGCPVITSNVSCLPEVAGDAALKISPHSVDELLQAMVGVADNAALGGRLRALGQERVKLFDWKRTARVVADAIVSYG